MPQGTDDPGHVIDYHVAPELFDGRWSTLARSAAIFLTLPILMAVLAGFSTYVAVSQATMR